MGRGDDPPRLSGLMFQRNTSGGQERSFGEVSGGTEYPMKRPVGARPLSEGVSLKQERGRLAPTEPAPLDSSWRLARHSDDTF